MAVPNTFAAQLGPIPLSELDANFATPITIGSTACALGATVTTIAGLTLTAPSLTNATATGTLSVPSSVTVGTGSLTIGAASGLTIGAGNILTTSGAFAVQHTYPLAATYTFPNLATATLATTSTLTQTFSGSTTFSNANGTFGSSTGAGTYSLGSGATTNGTTRTINIGTAGVSGSIVNVTVGSSASTSGTTTLQSAVTTVTREFRVSQLSSGRIPYVSTSGRLVDNAGFTLALDSADTLFALTYNSSNATQFSVDNGNATGISLIISRVPTGAGDAYIASAATTGRAICQLESGAGDAFTRAILSGTQTWTWGLDESASQAWVLAASDTLGTSNALSVATTGAATWTSNMTILGATAIPAGGTAGAGYKFSSTSNYGVFFGSGAPTLSAAKGSLYLRSDGSATNNRAYINTDGSTAWTAITTVA